MKTLDQLKREQGFGKYADQTYAPPTTAGTNRAEDPNPNAHPDMGVDRYIVMNLATTPQTAIRYLESKGWQAQSNGGWNIAVRKKGEDEWFSLDPKGFDAGDLLDIGGDVASGIGAGIGAGAGFFGGSLPGMMAGGAAGGALSEVAKQGIGKMFGLDPTMGEALTGAAGEAALGGAAPALGAAAKWGLGKLLPGGAAHQIAGLSDEALEALGKKQGVSLRGAERVGAAARPTQVPEYLMDQTRGIMRPDVGSRAAYTPARLAALQGQKLAPQMPQLTDDMLGAIEAYVTHLESGVPMVSRVREPFEALPPMIKKLVALHLKKGGSIVDLPEAITRAGKGAATKPVTPGPVPEAPWNRDPVGGRFRGRGIGKSEFTPGRIRMLEETGRAGPAKRMTKSAQEIFDEMATRRKPITMMPKGALERQLKQSMRTTTRAPLSGRMVGTEAAGRIDDAARMLGAPPSMPPGMGMAPAKTAKQVFTEAGRDDAVKALLANQPISKAHTFFKELSETPITAKARSMEGYPVDNFLGTALGATGKTIGGIGRVLTHNLTPLKRLATAKEAPNGVRRMARAALEAFQSKDMSKFKSTVFMLLSRPEGRAYIESQMEERSR